MGGLLLLYPHYVPGYAVMFHSPGDSPTHPVLGDGVTSEYRFAASPLRRFALPSVVEVGGVREGSAEVMSSLGQPKMWCHFPGKAWQNARCSSPEKVVQKRKSIQKMMEPNSMLQKLPKIGL